MTSIFKPIEPFFGYSRDPPAFTNRSITRREKVCRVLFEPINRQETQIFLERELSMHRTNETSKWEFDFQKGVPLRSAGRYVWKAVRPTSDNITMAPKRRRSVDEVDNSELYPQPLEKRIPVVRDEDEEAVDKNANKKQMKITDFMQVRKRQADSSIVKLMTPRPTKISRQAHCS